jgi:hypothetical protein
MSGLDSPRGVAFAGNGDLYVAEAGRGAPCTPASELTLPPRNLVVCIGRTGAISRLRNGSQSRFVTGLPSWISKVTTPSAEITGPHDVSFLGRGQMFVPVGWGGTATARTTGPAARHAFGRLLRVGPQGKRVVAADIAAFEQAHNPAAGPVDSNPYAVLAEGPARIVADAGANAVYRVTGNWNVSLLATLPAAPNPAGCTIPLPPPGGPAPPASEPVPTSVVRGPDRALYVSELSGFPFCAGTARIWRIADGQAPVVHASGFKMIIDLAFAPDGTLYVLQYATSPALPGGPGRIVRIARDGTRTTIDTGATLQQPAGIAVGRDGALYVSNKTVTPGSGEVLRIVP